MEYMKLDELMEFPFFSNDYLYKKYLLGYCYYYRNDRYIDVIEEVRYYVLSHRNVYCISVDYNTTTHESWIADFQIKEIKGKLRRKRANYCNEDNPKVRYVQLDEIELERNDFLDLINHPCGNLDNGSLAYYLQNKYNPAYGHNNLVDYINSIILSMRA